MSQITLTVLKSDIHTEKDIASDTRNSLNALAKIISNTLDDRVGKSAGESLRKITDRFALNMDSGLTAATRATDALDTGYNKSDVLFTHAENLCARANLIIKELGEI